MKSVRIFEEKHGAIIYPISDYVKIKNNYCIAYFGPMNEYIVQLSAIRPIIEKIFSGIKMFIACRDDTAHLVNGDVILASDMPKKKKMFSYIKELKTDFEQNPVLELLLESNIKIPEDYFKLKCGNRKYAIVKSAIYPPTESLSENQIKLIQNMAACKGYEIADVDKAGWVIGVESPELYIAGINGIKTSLIPTGVGTKLYNMMFPSSGEILYNLTS